MTLLSKTEGKGEGAIFQFYEKVLVEVFCYYEHSLCLWNLNTISNTIRDCFQISPLLLVELKTIKIIKPNRDETWGWSLRLKQKYVCIFLIFLGDESVCQKWLEKGGTTVSKMKITTLETNSKNVQSRMFN